MIERWLQIDRRSFLKWLVVAGAMTATPHIVSRVVTWLANQETEQKAKPSETEPTPGSVLFGGRYIGKDLEAQTWFYQQANIINIFPGWEEQYWGNQVAKVLVGLGKIPMISLRPNDNYFKLTDKGQVEKVKEKAVMFNQIKPLWVRPFYEMNGNWFEYGSDRISPETFVKGWKSFAEGLKMVAPEAKLVFSPNVGYPIEPYFPGDGWIDMTGLDGYNKSSIEFSRMTYPDLPFDLLFGPDIYTIKQISKKPLIVSEIGVDRRNPEARGWFVKALEKIPKLGISAVCIFAENKTGNLVDSEADWDVLKNGGWKEMDRALRSQVAYKMQNPPGRL